MSLYLSTGPSDSGFVWPTIVAGLSGSQECLVTIKLSVNIYWIPSTFTQQSMPTVQSSALAIKQGKLNYRLNTAGRSRNKPHCRLGTKIGNIQTGTGLAWNDRCNCSSPVCECVLANLSMNGRFTSQDKKTSLVVSLTVYVDVDYTVSISFLCLTQLPHLI